MFTFFSTFNLSCKKGNDHAESPYDLDVVLRSQNNKSGHGNNPAGFIKFRQDPDQDKIINLDIWVQNLEPNHEYLLQRAVDAIDIVDGNCTSTSWLTLGKGLVAQSIQTDKNGKGSESLWRDITAIPTGSKFDIHFRMIDAISMVVVLDSDCYQYVVR
jgi:hypothetical protein